MFSLDYTDQNLYNLPYKLTALWKAVYALISHSTSGEI